MAIQSQISIIVLAAGASIRLGLPKQLLFYSGTTLIRRAIETGLRSKADAVHVVLGYEAQSMHKEIKDLQVDIINNPHWKKGISTSIRAGVQSLGPTTKAAIIMLCDQPKVSMELLNTLIDTYESTRAPIVTCRYARTVGVPTLYDCSIFSELTNLRDDHGAKPIIERYATTRMEIDFPGGEDDIDTLDDQGKAHQ